MGQLDDLTSLSAKSVGNLTYWIVGSVLHATLDLREGALARPLGLYVAKLPPTGPPPQLDAEACPTNAIIPHWLIRAAGG